MNLNHRSKYSAVAAAVAVACAGGAYNGANAASVVAPTTLAMSEQYIAAATSNTSQNVTFAVAIGADYVSGDRAKLIVSGAEFLTSGSIGVPDTGTVGTCTLSVIGFADKNTINYRVPSAGMASGTECVFTAPVKVNSITGDAVSLSFSSQFNTGETLEAAVEDDVISVGDQFAAAVQKALAGVVDVEKARYHFTEDDTSSADLIASGYESQLVVAITNDAADFDYAAKVSNVTVKVTGDFAWLDDTSSGFGTCASSDLTSGNARAAFASNAGPTASQSFSNCGTLSYVQSAGTNGLSLSTGFITIALGKAQTNTATNGTYDKVIPAPTSYSASVTFTYYNQSTSVTGTETAVSGASAGSFTLNGSTVYVPFLPYGSGTTRILYLSNRSDQEGSVSATAIADGTGQPCPSFDVATAKAEGVTLLTSGVDAGIAACYGDDYNGKVSLTITSNIPGGQAEIFSGYNRNGSITSIPNSSNGRGSEARD